MSRKFNRYVGLFLTMTMLVFMLFPATLLAAPKDKVKANNVKVHLKGMSKTDKLPYGLMKKAYKKGEVAPYIIVFSGPIEPPMKLDVKHVGAKLVEYIPDFAFLATMTPAMAQKIKDLPYVEDVMIYQPAYKVNPSLKDEFGNIKAIGDEVTVRILTFGEDTAVLDNEIINAHGKKLAHGKGKVVVKMHRNQLEKFANMNSVKYIEE